MFLSKKRKLWSSFFVAIICFSLIFACSSNLGLPEDIKTGINFVKRELINADGLLETYPLTMKENPYDPDYKKESLSESVSLWMWILKLVGKKKDMDSEIEVFKEYFQLPNRTLSWRVAIEGEKVIPSPYSATIDDLRVIRVLFEAEKKWGDKEYRKFAMELADAMKSDAVYKNHMLHQPLREGDEEGPFIMDLSYLDLEAMHLLSEVDSDWNAIYEKSIEVLIKGKRSNGFFYDKYNVGENRYYDEEKNLINHIICAIHLAEKGFSVNTLVNFLEKKWREDGKIFGRYDPDTGEPIVKYESLSVYGLLMKLALIVEREEFAGEIKKRILEFRVTDRKSKWFGSLCGENCHSFDHLEPLLTFCEERVRSETKSR